MANAEPADVPQEAAGTPATVQEPLLAADAAAGALSGAPALVARRAAGDQVIVAGSGFTPGEQVTVVLEREAGSDDQLVMADAGGAFSAYFRLGGDEEPVVHANRADFSRVG